MTTARAHFVTPGSDGCYHCVQRCVRRAFLCGVDGYTGQSFEHRKAWVEERLHRLGSCFAIAIHAYAVMSNGKKFGHQKNSDTHNSDSNQKNSDTHNSDSNEARFAR